MSITSMTRSWWGRARTCDELAVRDHTAVNKQALALVKKLKVTPEDNDTSKALSKQAADKRAELAKLKGAAFDKACVDNEVAYHKTVNGALEKTLIPSASNAELKNLLQAGLKIFQGHEQHAEHVAADVKLGPRHDALTDISGRHRACACRPGAGGDRPDHHR
jgi:predicted outer membrane protein